MYLTEYLVQARLCASIVEGHSLHILNMLMSKNSVEILLGFIYCMTLFKTEWQIEDMGKEY